MLSLGCERLPTPLKKKKKKKKKEEKKKNQELSEANHGARRWAGEKLNISPLDIGHKRSDIGLRVIINIDTNHMCLYSIYILQHYTKQCPKE